MSRPIPLPSITNIKSIYHQTKSHAVPWKLSQSAQLKGTSHKHSPVGTEELRMRTFTPPIWRIQCECVVLGAFTPLFFFLNTKKTCCRSTLVRGGGSWHTHHSAMNRENPPLVNSYQQQCGQSHHYRCIFPKWLLEYQDASFPPPP